MITKLPNTTLQSAASSDGTVRVLSKDDIAGSRTLFNEGIMVERTPLIELNSALGLSALRDLITITETATITNSGGEHILATGTTTAATATLTTVEYGRYYPGTSAQTGMGVRAPGAYTGTAFAEWGYFGPDDGFGWGKDATGPYIFFIRDSAKTKVYQEDWNIDTLEGGGPSGGTLTQSDGNIYQLNFSWYGYGVIEWSIVVDSPAGDQLPVIIHRIRPTAANSIQNPNQPITAKVSNGDTTTNYELYVGGRQFSVYSKYIPSIRRTQEDRLALTDVGTTMVPLISFRRKAGFLSFPVKFHQIGIITGGNLLWEIRIGGTLTGDSFGAVSNIPAAETALEVDRAATAITGGQKLESGLVATTGAGNSISGGFSSSTYNLELPGTTIITLCARTISGTAAVSAMLGMEEEW